MTTPLVMDLSTLNGVPPGSPLTGTDVLLIGRPPSASTPNAVMTPMAATMTQVAAFVQQSLAINGIQLDVAGTTFLQVIAGKVSIIQAGTVVFSIANGTVTATGQIIGGGQP